MEFLPKSLFINNRSKLVELLLPSSIVIISSNRQMPRNGDQHYPYRQSSDLYYLTGIKQELSTLVIFPSGGPTKYKEILFIAEGDKKKDMWEGERLTIEDAKEISGINDIRLHKDLLFELKKIIPACSYVYFGMEYEYSEDLFPSNELEIRKGLSNELGRLQEHKLYTLLTKIRMLKEPEELAMIKKAISITGEAFIRILQNLKPGMKENEIEAHISYTFRTMGVESHAFNPIIASGKNALILHYLQNDDICADGELLLLDFGADWHYYAADISRTIPVNGRYSLRQREIYEANLRVLNQSIVLMKPGILISELNKQVGELWQEQHINLGLYTMEDLKKKSKMWPMWQNYYWHGTSHSIGIDVHDLFDPNETLKEGMVLSCEPGIYIPEEGLGIRLENDILINGEGAINLSENIPVDPDAIELIMNKA